MLYIDGFRSVLINHVVSWGCRRDQVEWGSMPEDTLRRLANVLTGNGLQIGGFVGISHCYLASSLAKNKGTICTIDPNITHNHTDNPMLIAVRLAIRLNLKNSMFILGYAEEQMKILINQGAKFDFILIDGNHDENFVLSEVLLADQLLKSGGYLVLDDIDDWHGPKSVYMNFPLDYEKIKLDSRAALLQKK